MDPHAQYEIRAYADALFGVLEQWLPVTAEAFCHYRLEAADLSGPMLAVVRAWLAGRDPERDPATMSKREWRELHELLGRPLAD